MSPIEQAARRLEELRRAGADVPDSRPRTGPARLQPMPSSARSTFIATRCGRRCRARSHRRAACPRVIHSAHRARSAAAARTGLHHARCADEPDRRRVPRRQASDHPQRPRQGRHSGQERQPGDGHQRAARRGQDVHVAEPRAQHRARVRQHGAAGRRRRRAPDDADAARRAELARLARPAHPRRRRRCRRAGQDERGEAVAAAGRVEASAIDRAPRKRADGEPAARAGHALLRSHHRLRLAAIARDHRGACPRHSDGTDRHGGRRGFDQPARGHAGTRDDRELRDRTDDAEQVEAHRRRYVLWLLRG